MPRSKEFNEEEDDFSLEQNEEDENYCTVRQSLDSMVSRRAEKYKNYSHPSLQKSNENLIEDQIETNKVINSDKISDKISDKSSDYFETANSSSSDSTKMMEKTKKTKESTKENTTREFRVIHRPPLPPSTSKLIHKQIQNFNDFQMKAPNFNDIIDNILSSNANIREYLRELRKNSELDYLLLSKILEKTLVPKSNVHVQTDQQTPTKTYRSVETNTVSPTLNQKQTQTRESRILSYKLLETENLFEKLKIQNNFTSNSNYEIKRTSDLKIEEEPITYESTDFGGEYETEQFSKYESTNKNYETSSSKFCTNCNQTHNEQMRNKTIKIEDKFIGNHDKIHLWNNLLQVDDTSEFSEDTTNQSIKQETTASENQSSTLSDDDQFSVSTRKSTKKSYSSIKSTKSIKSIKSSTKSIRSIKEQLLSERETDLIDRYNRIKECKLKYECEKKEFIELRKQFKNLRKKLNEDKKNELKKDRFENKQKLEFDDYHQPISTKQNQKEPIKEHKKISFNDKYSNGYQCDRHTDLPVYETTSVDDTETFDDTKDEEESYLTDSEYSVLDRSTNHIDTKNVDFIDQDENAEELNQINQDKLNESIKLNQKMNKQNKEISNQGAVRTESKILIETTNLRKKEISEISSQTELTKDGSLSRKTQVTNVKKVPVLVPLINNLQYADSPQFNESLYDNGSQFNTKTPEPIITSPISTAAATPSGIQCKHSRKKHRSNTVEIHSVTPSTTKSCSRPTSAIDLSHQMDDELNNNTINRSKLNQDNGKFFTNSYSESELNAMKKDKHYILNEQMNFGISEPFMAYDSTIYDENKQTKGSKNYSEPLKKALKMTFQRKPSFNNKRLVENSNLQQIIEWQDTNSSTITNEINSEPFRSVNGNAQDAKTVSLTTETTLKNKGNERTIETKSKAIRKFDLDTNKSTKSNPISKDDRSASRCSNSSKTVTKNQQEQDEETSFNCDEKNLISGNSNNDLKRVDKVSKCDKCDKCDNETKKKKLTNSLKSTKKDELIDKKMRTKNYDEKSSKECYREEEYTKRSSKSICVKNVNHLDYDYLNMLPNSLFDPMIDKIPNLDHSFDKLVNSDKNLDKLYLDDSNDSNYVTDDLSNGKMINDHLIDKSSTQLNDNLSKLSFDSGHSSSMSNLSYQNKLFNNKKNGLVNLELDENSVIEETNLDNLSDLNNCSNDELNQTDNNLKNNRIIQDNDLSLVKSNIDELSKSLVPKLKSNNLIRNTEIINRITKTVYPESLKKKQIKKKKFVFEQQLNSPSNDKEQNDCKISSLITMEIPCNLRKKSKCSKCYKDRKMNTCKLTKTTEYYESTSFLDPEIEQNSNQSLSSTCSSETDSLINEEDLNTLTKFQKFKPVLIDQDDNQTTWEYSLECNCFNGINASVKTTVTQFHQKNQTFLNNFQEHELNSSCD